MEIGHFPNRPIAWCDALRRARPSGVSSLLENTESQPYIGHVGVEQGGEIVAPESREALLTLTQATELGCQAAAAANSTTSEGWATNSCADPVWHAGRATDISACILVGCSRYRRLARAQLPVRNLRTM